jgi:hypothetical protein
LFFFPDDKFARNRVPKLMPIAAIMISEALEMAGCGPRFPAVWSSM